MSVKNKSFHCSLSSSLGSSISDSPSLSSVTESPKIPSPIGGRLRSGPGPGEWEPASQHHFPSSCIGAESGVECVRAGGDFVVPAARRRGGGTICGCSSTHHASTGNRDGGAADLWVICPGGLAENMQHISWLATCGHDKWGELVVSGSA